ncbi:MAG: serine/threonine protein kinase [Lachnospiraceae bacterium]|nr:serine/threonine protein kinase [Lachnospiraceae bacterium]
MKSSAEGGETDWTERYRVTAVLKERGGTRVCLAEHLLLKQKRIIKTVCRTSGEAEAALREAVLMRGLRHPCIPEIYDIEEQESGFSIIEEYIPGESLTSYFLSKYPETEEIISFSVQLCGLLEYLHGRKPPVLHLDIKPDNLIVCRGRLHLVDFGSARQTEQGGEAAALTGTPGYAAPECYRGAAGVRSDLYAVGRLLEFMLSHSAERRGRKQRARRKSLLRVMRRAQREKPEERYPSASAMKRALLAVGGAGADWAGCRTVGIAACTRRMGATYIAFLFAAFLQQKRKRVLYLECNESGTVIRLPVKERPDRPPEFQGIPVAEARGTRLRICGEGYGTAWERNYFERLGYQIVLEDFGALTPENLKAFLSADLSLFLVGGRVWERETMWKGMTLLSRCQKRPIVLVNFSGEREFKELSGQLPDVRCLRLPLAAEPADSREGGELWELFDELWDGPDGLTAGAGD